MNIAIITARGGSKGLPGKNLLLFNGLPLLAWTIKAAQNSAIFEHIIVTSDDEMILATAVAYGATPLDRPPHLANDEASSFDAYIHAIDTISSQVSINIDNAALLQPTSPLRSAKHLRDAYKLMTPEVNGVISVYQPSSHPMKAYILDDKGYISGLCGDNMPYQPRQSLPSCCYANGAIYIFRLKSLEGQTSFPSQKVAPYFMSEEDSSDIDTKEDLDNAEKIMRAQHVQKT